MALRREDVQVTDAVVVSLPRRRTATPLRRARMVARRRRALAGLAALAVFVVTVLGGGGDGSAVASRPGAPPAVVLPAGGSLWEIADRYARSGVDRRAYVDAVVELNGVGPAAPAGTRIELP